MSNDLLESNPLTPEQAAAISSLKRIKEHILDILGIKTYSNNGLFINGYEPAVDLDKEVVEKVKSALLEYGLTPRERLEKICLFLGTSIEEVESDTGVKFEFFQDESTNMSGVTSEIMKALVSLNLLEYEQFRQRFYKELAARASRAQKARSEKYNELRDIPELIEYLTLITSEESGIYWDVRDIAWKQVIAEIENLFGIKTNLKALHNFLASRGIDVPEIDANFVPKNSIVFKIIESLNNGISEEDIAQISRILSDPETSVIQKYSMLLEMYNEEVRGYIKSEYPYLKNTLNKLARYMIYKGYLPSDFEVDFREFKDILIDKITSYVKSNGKVDIQAILSSEQPSRNKYNQIMTLLGLPLYQGGATSGSTTTLNRRVPMIEEIVRNIN